LTSLLALGGSIPRSMAGQPAGVSAPQTDVLKSGGKRKLEQKGQQKRPRISGDAVRRKAPLGATATEEDGEGWSESENEALAALRAATALSGEAVSSGSRPKTGGDRGWQAGLEALQRDRPFEQDAKRDKWTQEEVMTVIREALQTNAESEWSRLFQGVSPKPREMDPVIRRLEPEEVVKALKAFVDKYESTPRKQVLCMIWMDKLLQIHPHTLATNPQATALLQRLLALLEERVGSGWHYMEAQTCLGKWKLIFELATMRKTTVEERARAQEPAAATTTTKGPALGTPQGGDEESDEDDDDEVAQDDDNAADSD